MGLIQTIRSTIADVPKVVLVPNPTLLEGLPNLSRYLGIKIFVKREDLTPVGLGGNKVRKLEYLMADALSKGATCAITTASLHSNFLRMFTSVCRKLSLKPVVVARGEQPDLAGGNYLCYKLMGAEIHFVQTADPFSDGTMRFMSSIAEKKQQQGEVPYLIHLATYSAPLAILGYADVAREVLVQAEKIGVQFHQVFVASGSGGTAGGLAVGLRERHIVVNGISVNLSAHRLKEVIHEGIGNLPLHENIDSNQCADLSIDEGFIGECYSVPPIKSVEAVRLVAELEGLILDPIYTGRAMAALIEYCRLGRIRSQENVLFVHTGGMPNLFEYSRHLA